MTPPSLREQLFDSSRGRIVALLRRGALTVQEIAAGLGLTGNAVRAQLAAMERDGLVRRGALRPGTTRPSHVYELTLELEQLLSRAYVPFLTHVVHTFAERESPEAFDAAMRDAGRALGAELRPRVAGASLAERVAAASRLLTHELGALTEVERANAHFVIRGHGCPLAAATGKHPSVCHAIESLLAEQLGTRVHECCEREGRPRCCFEVYPDA